MTHQVVVKNIAKCEFSVGLASLMVTAIGAESLQHIQEKLAEIWVNLETMKDLLRAAEADAPGSMNGASCGRRGIRSIRPVTSSAALSRMVEIIQQIGASGLVAMPMEADLKGPLIEDIRRYYQAARAEAFDRIPLFRLAWGAKPSQRLLPDRCCTSGSSLGIRYAWPARCKCPIMPGRSGTRRCRAGLRQGRPRRSSSPTRGVDLCTRPP